MERKTEDVTVKEGWAWELVGQVCKGMPWDLRQVSQQGQGQVDQGKILTEQQNFYLAEELLFGNVLG